MVPVDNMYLLLLIIFQILFTKHMFIDTANKIMSVLLDDVQTYFYSILKVFHHCKFSTARGTIC